MLRLTALIATLVALAPVGPIGCPPTDVLPDDQFPIVRGELAVTAEATESATVGQTVTLRAAVAPAADDGTLRYSWLQIGGPGVAIARADSATARFVAPSLPSDQRLTFLVTVSNQAGDVGRAQVRVLVRKDPDYGQVTPSGPPVANAGDDQTVKENTTVTLDGSGSIGRSLRYRWRQVSGKTVTLSDANAVRTSFTAPMFDPDGTNKLLFELAVTDSLGRTTTDRVQVSIKDPTISETQVIVDTTLGSFTLELYPDKSPITVANFFRYVDEGFYDGTLIHRVIKNFVIQGGGYEPGMVAKKTHDPIKNEAKTNGLSNIRGTIAMARMNEPNSATSQWFINLKNNVKDGDGLSNLDPGGVTPDGYCVFGHVIAGMDVVDKIAEVETDPNDKPVEDVIVNSIKRVVTPRPGGGNQSWTPTETSGQTTRSDESGQTRTGDQE